MKGGLTGGGAAGLIPALLVAVQFDRVIVRALESRVTAKASMKGQLASYRYLDNVWDFVVSDVTIKLWPTQSSNRREEQELTAASMKLVLVDARCVPTDTQQ